MNKEEVDKFCKEYYGYTIEESDKDIGYWMDKHYKLKQENNQLKEELKKADSLTQSCIFDGKEESQLNFRKAINIIKELRSWLEEYINTLKENDIYDRDMYENGELSMLESVLSKLNELEGGKIEN